MSQPQMITRAYDASITDVEAGKRQVVATITTDAVDRYREAILPKGVAVKRYLTNPVVLWAHNLGEPPIGRCLWIKPTGDGRGLVAKTQFADTAAGVEIFGLYRDEILRAFSVGAIPDPASYSKPTEKEVRERPELAGCDRIIRKCELFEYSACPVPVNTEALAIAVSKGLVRTEAVRLAIADSTPLTAPAPALPGLAGCRSFGDVHASLLRQLRADPVAMARKAASDRLDLLRGRI